MKKAFYWSFLIVFLVFAVIISSGDSSYAQLTAAHDYGKLWINVVDNGNWDNEGWGGTGEMTWPQGNHRRDIIKFWWIWVTAKEWKNAEGGMELQVDFSPEKDFPGEARGASFQQTTRWNTPEIIVDGQNVGMPFYGDVDNNLKYDCMIDWVWDAYRVIGVQGHQKTYSWANPDFDDFIIVDHSLKLTLDIDGDGVQDCPDQTVELAWTEGPAGDPADEGHRNYSLSWYSSESWATYDVLTSKYVTDKPRKDLYVSYAYDSDDLSRGKRYYTGSDKVIDDTGDPRRGVGTFLSYQYIGNMTMHADKSPSDVTDDAAGKPNSVTYLELGKDLWGHDWGMGKYDYMVQGKFRKEIYHEKGGLGNYNSRSSNPFYMMQTWGPYSMEKGDEVRSVYAMGAGGIGEDLTFSKGKEFHEWMVNDAGTFDAAAKNALIATGKDSLFEHLDRAYWVFHNGMNVSDPPPVPDLEVTSGLGQISIEWGYPSGDMFKDHDTGVDDFKEWKLYRKMGGPRIDDPGDANQYFPFELVGTFPKGTTSYTDTDVQRGVSYHYCVTGVDDGTQNLIGPTGFTGYSLEGSFYKNRTRKSAISVDVGAETSDEVAIVPNPYSISTGLSNKLNWPGEPNQIQFMNLPVRCTLKIYNVTGDLIKTIEHNGGADEPWVDMRTASNQYPASGVYILVVENARNDNGDSLPNNISKFVIVR